MPLWLDKKYVNFVAPKLSLFSWKKPDLANFRCPYCGDSATNKRKTRGYLYVKGGDMFFRCHNCGNGRSVSNFIKDMDPAVHSEYLFELFALKTGNTKPEVVSKPVFVKPKFEPTTLKKGFKYGERLSELPKNHFARLYFNGRCLPERYLDELVYTEDMHKFVHENVRGDRNAPEKPFLVIPIRNENGFIVGFNARNLAPDSVYDKYFKVRYDDETPLIFGRELLDTSKRVFVFEGEFDSMFVKNSVAVGGISSMPEIERELKVPKSMVTLVMDKDYRNKQVVKAMECLIEDGYTVVLFPGNIDAKDVNDLVKDHKYTPMELTSFLEKNSHSGLVASLELNKLKRVTL